ncbi:ORF_044R [Scale drop disease virus]|uniref:ORF_044R n=1 Tax=Scale drop disease virus TaxID=1697349 RepID=A0A0K1L6G4_9VIRU|nr:ORF_044R [Scale drop disease virus]AKU37459.1 ORF_044R [Scale drop disease virus]
MAIYTLIRTMKILTMMILSGIQSAKNHQMILSGIQSTKNHQMILSQMMTNLNGTLLKKIVNLSQAGHQTMMTNTILNGATSHQTTRNRNGAKINPMMNIVQKMKSIQDQTKILIKN